MIDLSGFRPFSLAAFDRALTPGIYGPAQLITACQVKQMGFVDAHEPSAGAWALASWLLDHRDGIEGAARAGSHPLNSGSLIERILAGDVVPEETFATAIAAMTDGAVLPDMFARPMRMARSEETPDAAGGAPLSADADGKAPEAGAVSPCSSPVPAPSLPRALPETDRCASANTLPEVDPCASANTLPEVDPCASANTLPAMGGLGGALPPGRLFHPIADSRFTDGFVLTGCGIALNLDESTAAAMRAAIDAGLDHLRARRGGAAKAGDTMRKVAA